MQRTSTRIEKTSTPMKTRKKSETYAILSLREIRQLLAIAEADAVGRYGHNPSEAATVVLRGHSLRYENKVQVQFDTVSGHPLFVA